jgi:hypothetical protein
MIGYHIDAVARTITEIDYTYFNMRTWLPGGVTIGIVYDNGDVLYVDDEGLLHPATRAFRIKKRADGQPMMSDGILTGEDDMDEGDIGTLPPQFTIEQLQEEIEWLTVEEALQWFRDRINEPSITINGAPIAYWREMLAAMEGKR